MKSSVLALIAVALTAACGGGTAATQSKPSTSPRPVAMYRNSLPGLNATGKIDLIQNVIDFAPGAASVVHTHSSPNLATVLQGQITVKIPAGDKQASQGEMLVEPINQPLQAMNAGSGEAMVVVAFAVPHGGKPTAPVAGKPAPATPNKTLYTFTFDSPAVTGPYSLVQQVVDFAPGSQTSRQRVGGPGVITVLQGQVVVNTDGVEQTFKAGESFTEIPGQTLQVFNQGSSDLVLAATFALPDGAQLTKNV
jgi:quercetin dioxygenase-like cupin family protein